VGFVIYKESAEAVKLDLSQTVGAFSVAYINPKTGQVTSSSEIVKAGSVVEFSSNPSNIIWLKKRITDNN